MRSLFLLPVLAYSCTFADVLSDDSLTRRTTTNSAVVNSAFCDNLCRDVVGIMNKSTKENENYIFDRALYYHRVDTLPQVKFWRTIMKLREDSALINIGETREVIQRVSLREWNVKTEEEKQVYRDSVRCVRNLDSTYRVLITTGKRFFYDFDNASQNFQKGIGCFIDNDVDPWYAQAILLIESPNKLQKSNVGAYGPFQLMKDVARMYGLKVNRHQDERADFSRSAYAASSLIKNICIPYARRMLDSLQISGYSQDELWFRLLVMHVYHAGAGNVQKALFAMNPKKGDMDLIYTLWQTTTARFKSASQNYSQLVLAAMLEMDQRRDLPYRDVAVAGN